MADDAPTLELRIQDNSDKAVQGIKSLATSLSKLRDSVTNGLGLDKVITELDTFNQKLQATFSNEAVDKINKVADALEKLASVREVKIPEISVGKVVQDAVSGSSIVPEDVEQAIVAQSVVEATDQMRDYTSAIEEQKNEVENLGESVGTTGDKIERQAISATRATDAVKKHSMAFKDLMNAGKKVIHPLDDIIKKFNRILFYRAIRTVLREIAKGFSEGLKNVRAYSKAISGSFDKAMTSAENTMFKLKNTLGAALTPAIEAVIPWVQQLTNWFITLVNYVNQFLALVTGKSQWTRAIDASASSFEKTKKAAGGAAKEVKNLLAGFDELNIIQSESGGGGGGAGKIDPDYTTAFEEVYEFDNKIRNIVNWLKDNFNEVWSIAKSIGATFLAWRVSNAFKGIIGKLASFVAAGALIKLTWDITTKFSDEYLKTGDIGWLIANVVETAVGAFLGGKIAESILGTGNAEAGIAMVLTVSALADITSSIRNVDVSALSKENIINTIIASLKFGTAIGLIVSKFFKFNTSSAIMAGGGAALLTFGAAIGIKAIVTAVKTDEFNADYLKETALASVTTGLGAGLAFGAAHVGLARTITGAAGTGLLTFGVMTGVQAVMSVVKSGWTLDSIKKTALASAGVGVGSAFLAFALGAPAGIAGIIGTGAAVATVGAVVGIAAILKNDASKTKWGNYKATEEEIQAYVKGKMFSIDVDAEITAINATIDKATINKDAIEADVSKLISPMNVLKLGVDDKATIAEIYNVVYGADRESGLLGNVRSAIEGRKQAIKLGLTLLPYIDKQGKDISASMMQSGIEGWNEVEKHMTDLGKELNSYLLDSNGDFKTKLEDWERERVNELLKAIADIASATAGSEVQNKAMNALDISLSNMSENSAREAMKAFGEYRQELIAGYIKIQNEQAASYDALASINYQRANAALKNNDEAAYEKFKSEADKYSALASDLYQSAIDKANDKANEASAQGARLIKETLTKVYGDALDSIGDNSKFKSAWGDAVNKLNFHNGEGVSERLYSGIKTALLYTLNMTEKELENYHLEISDLLPDTAKSAILSKVAGRFGDDIAAELATAIKAKVPEATTQAIIEAEGNAIQEANEQVKPTITLETDVSQEQLESLNATVSVYGEQIVNLEETKAEAQTIRDLIEEPIDAPTVETSSLTESVNNASKEVNDAVDSMIRDLNRLSSASVNINFDYSFWRGGAGGGNKWTSQMFRAGGGFVGTGDMFIARESGPELVGRIGNRTAVANNDQIVSGVANGVAAGQSEQNSLLRQQNDLLRQMLAKSGRVEAVPSADWGRFVKRSSEMYAYNTGM